MKNILPEQFVMRPVSDIRDRWFLLTAGNFAEGRYNTMTVSWLTMGVMWAKPVAQVFARPQRYTREFLDAYPDFTLSLFPEKYRPALQLLGTKSGRDCDKIAESGLTPTASTVVAAPSFAEAELVIEMKKLFAQKLDPASFVETGIIPSLYPNRDFHTFYFGEMLAIRGTGAWCS